MGIRGSLLSALALTLSTVAGAQTPTAGDGGSGAERRIVIVPAQPSAPANQPNEVQTSAPQQRIVIVPAQPETAPAAPAPDAGAPQQKLVIVPVAGADSAPQATPDAQPSGSPPTTASAPSNLAPQPESQPSGIPETGSSAESAEGDSGAASADGLRTVTASPDLTPRPDGDIARPPPSTPAPIASGPAIAPDGLTEGHVRTGPFLSGPGSSTFVLHHTLMGAAGGFTTLGISNDFHSSGREAILAGTLVGAGIGFGTSSWWQFNHGIGQNTANFGITNSLSGGMFLTGLIDLTTDDPTALAWSSVLGAELGAWMTAGIGGGDLSLESGLLVASGQSWGAIYGSLLLAIVRYSGSSLRTESALDALFITQGAGAILTAFAVGHFHPSVRQILRADIAGAIVGGAVLLLSALVVGHLDSPTPYVLSMASSATTMALVSIFWDEGAERPTASLGGGSPAAYRSVW